MPFFPPQLSIINVIMYHDFHIRMSSKGSSNMMLKIEILLGHHRNRITFKIYIE